MYRITNGSGYYLGGEAGKFCYTMLKSEAAKCESFNEAVLLIKQARMFGFCTSISWTIERVDK